MTDNLSEHAATSKPILLDGCETSRQNPYHTTGGTMKHCIDCAHYGRLEGRSAKCLRDAPSATESSPIDGKPWTTRERIEHGNSRYCELERFGTASYQCGIGARFFEPADTHDHRDGQSTAGKPEHDLDVTGRELKAGS